MISPDLLKKVVKFARNIGRFENNVAENAVMLSLGRVGEHFRKKEYKVTFEYKIGNGKSVDIVAEKDGRKIAIEIETGKSDFIHNIKKDLDYGFDKVIVIALDDKIKEKILTEIRKSEINSRNSLFITGVRETLANEVS